MMKDETTARGEGVAARVGQASRLSPSSFPHSGRESLGEDGPNNVRDRRDACPTAQLRLHIERLVLDGFPLPPGGAARFQAALEAEFGRLLTGVPAGNWASVSLASLAPASLRLAPGGSPETWGRQAARSLFAGLPMSASGGATENTFTGEPARFAGPSMEKPTTQKH